MMIYALLGILTVTAIIVAGVYWLVTNITFKDVKPRYEYKTDEKGNEYVKDNSDA